QKPAGRGIPDLLYSQAEEDLRSAVRSVLDGRSDWPAVLARTETSETYDTALWQVLAAEVGCGGLLIPDRHGGAGASYREAAVVAEETGRAVAPVPYLGSAVVPPRPRCGPRTRTCSAGWRRARSPPPWPSRSPPGRVRPACPAGCASLRRGPATRLARPG